MSFFKDHKLLNDSVHVMYIGIIKVLKEMHLVCCTVTILSPLRCSLQPVKGRQEHKSSSMSPIIHSTEHHHIKAVKQTVSVIVTA